MTDRGKLVFKMTFLQTLLLLLPSLFLYSTRKRALSNIVHWLGFCNRVLVNWIKNLAPHFQPIRVKTKRTSFPALTAGFIDILCLPIGSIDLLWLPLANANARFRSRLHSKYMNEGYPGEHFKNVSIIRRLQPYLWMNQTIEGKLFDVLRWNGDLPTTVRPSTQ